MPYFSQIRTNISKKKKDDLRIANLRLILLHNNILAIRRLAN